MNARKLTDSSRLSEVRASTSSQTTASDGAPARACSAASAAVEIARVDRSRAIEPRSVEPELLEVADDHAGLLARDVAQDHVALGLCATARNRTTFVTSGERQRRSRTRSESPSGATTRRCTIAGT